jgi:hypothetical protein
MSVGEDRLCPAMKLSLLTPLVALLFASACTTSTTEPSANAPQTAENPGTEPPTDDGTQGSGNEGEKGSAKPPAKPEPPSAPKKFPKIVLTGTFAKVDVTYGRVGQYIALDMKGDASLTSADPATVKSTAISVGEIDSYELIYPQKSGCDGVPKLTITKGAVHVELQRAGTPSGTISGCYYLSQFVKAKDGGFQARLTNVPIGTDGSQIEELLLDIQGPQS